MEKKVAYIFPGQGKGSVKVGMARHVYKKSKEARRIFALADNILGWPRSLAEYCFSGPVKELQEKNKIAQPAALTCNMAYFAARRDISLKELDEDIRFLFKTPPSFLAGHSLGLYAALVAAEVIDFATALKIVVKRALEMSNASKLVPGRMVVLQKYHGLFEIEKLCQKTGVEIANYNSHQQMVVGGPNKRMDDFEKTITLKKDLVEEIIPLDVEGAFHTSCMNSAVEPFAEFLNQFTFADPKIAVLANTSSKIMTMGEEIKEELPQQIYKAVRWVEGIDRLKWEEVSGFVEIGHGQVLTRLLDDRKIIKIGETATVAFATSLYFLRKAIKKEQVL